METKTKKPNARALQAALDAAQAELAGLREQLAERDREIAGHRKTSAQHEGDLAAVQAQLTQAKTALAPFYEKTKDWASEEWPPLHVSMTRKLTWGDLKRAAETMAGLR